MITLIHGDDSTASRNYYFELKQKSIEPITLHGATLTPTDLQQALSGSDLFGETKDIFIEELLNKRKPSKELDALISFISNHSSLIITLWESKEISKKSLLQFGKATIKQFKIPTTIFAFLDSLKPGNGKQHIELFHNTLKDKDAEFVLVMLQRQVRILLAVSSDPSISEIFRLAPWQKSKLQKQAQLFTQVQLVNLHSKLFQLELNMKTGQLSSSLENEIDFLLLTL